MYKFGVFGVDVQLRDKRNTADIVWINGNSYVRVALPSDANDYDWRYRRHTNEFGQHYFIVSVNGIGEKRWEVNNHYDLNREENAQVAEYFRTRESGNG